MQYKLGKRAPLVRDSVKFGNFLTTLPTTPLVDLAPSYSYPMDMNDTLSDCVVAGFDHFRQTVTGLLTGVPLNFTEQELLALYATQNPNGEDNGMNIQIFLEYLQSKGYILGFASIDYTNEAELKAAMYLGLGVMGGFVMTQAQMNQFDNKQPFDYVPNSPEEGGHCMIPSGFTGTPDYDSLITWGAVANCTQTFISKQMDEAWFVLTQAHVDHPSFRDHFDLPGFSQAVSEITGGKVAIPVPTTIINSMQNRKIQQFMAGIQIFEGWYPGSVSWSDNNPGNIMNVGQTLFTGKDASGKGIANSYQDGWTILYNMIYNACTGKSSVYHPTDTILQFFQKYTSDGSIVSQNYATFVASICGMPITTPISWLIG